LKTVNIPHYYTQYIDGAVAVVISTDKCAQAIEKKRKTKNKSLSPEFTGKPVTKMLQNNKKYKYLPHVRQ
jgi:hypothetical protein